MSSFYSRRELKEIGLKSFGENVLISKKCSIYSPQTIQVKDNVRIDDFCILSGEIQIGNNIHISAYTALYGAQGIVLEDYVTISGRNMIYSVNDDYSGEYMTNPMNNKHSNVSGGPVIFKKHVIVGCGCVVLPNVILEEGTAIGAMSLVNKSTQPWNMYVGTPIRLLKERSRNLLKHVTKEELDQVEETIYE